ncbi:AAA domain-containing protein [Daldinia loculata]|uniref:AAA domain-containing protein n=1 Tax=Daldinia loculata TaxID=103429 RepID=UPI0020C4C3F6|nr:AAA domain-containing protein [Daldinia loculata]KAI1652000.1 AAA domain-containing protein [Daldinia loculata]
MGDINLPDHSGHETGVGDTNLLDHNGHEFGVEDTNERYEAQLQQDDSSVYESGVEDFDLSDHSVHYTGIEDAGKEDTNEGDEARREQEELREKSDDLTDLPQVPPTAISRAVSCLVILGGTPLSMHRDDNLVKLGREPVTQYEFKLKLEYHPATYPRISVVFVRNLEIKGAVRRHSWVGRMEFYFQSVSELEAARQHKDRATISLNRDFKLEPGTVQAPNGCIYLSFRVSRVVFYYNEVMNKDPVFKAQIKQMAEFADSVNRGSPSEVAFLVTDDAHPPTWELSPDDPVPQSVPIVSTDEYSELSTNMNSFIAMAGIFERIVENNSDSLAPWFIRSPTQELLNAGTILEAGKEYEVAGGRKVTRPEIGIVPPCVKFFDLRQYKVAQTYGTVDDAARAQSVANEMAQKQFPCHLFALSQNKDDSGNPSAVAVAIPLGRDTHLLPHKGSDCKITISGLRRAKNPPYEINIETQLPEFLAELAFRAISRSQSADVFIQLCNVLKEDTPEDKSEEILNGLEQIYEDAYESGGVVDMDGLSAFVAEHAVYLQVPQVPDKEDSEEKLRSWNAWAADPSLPLLGGSFRVFIAKIPLEPWTECCGGERRRCNFGLEFPKEGENYGVYIQNKLQDDEAKFCTITVKHLTKTLRQEIQAHEEVQHPPSVPAETPGISDLALGIYNWLPTLEMPPDGSPSLKDHFELFPGMMRAVEGSAPAHLQRMYDSFDESKKQTFSQHMRKIPFGLAAIPGTAACGKSLFVKFYAALHLEEEFPEGEPPKVLIICPHNQALDDYELGFKRTLEKYGAPEESFPRMERVHSIPTEIKAAVRSFTREDLQAEATNELDATDHFLAESVLTEFQRYADEYTKQKGRKNFHTQSLHTSVLNYVREHPNDNLDIIELLELGKTNKTLSKDQKRLAEVHIKELYQMKLREAQIVFATPAAARETFFRNEFKPTLVVLDDNARMREITTVMCIASFPTAKLFVLLGDPRQLTPFTSSSPGDMTAPFDSQVKISCLDRLYRAGVSFKGLVHNHRQYADLQKEPSVWFYNGIMKSSIGRADRFPPSVVKVQQIIQDLTGIPGSNRVVVDITNSKEQRASASVKNERHAYYVLRALRYFYLDAGFTSLDATPGSIAVVPFYNAQVAEIESLLRNRKVVHNLFGVTPAKLAERVIVSTLDSFQGGQADLVILDYTRSDRPGFTGDSHRNAVAHTRSVQGEIVLLNESVFVPPSGHSRSWTNLRLMYRELERQSRVHRTVFYENCLDFGHEDKACNNAAQCSTCFEKGHTKSACPTVKCTKCDGPGHIATHCVHKN